MFTPEQLASIRLTTKGAFERCFRLLSGGGKPTMPTAFPVCSDRLNWFERLFSARRWTIRRTNVSRQGSCQETLLSYIWPRSEPFMILKVELLSRSRISWGRQARRIADQIGHRQESVPLCPQLPPIAFVRQTSHQFPEFLM